MKTHIYQVLGLFAVLFLALAGYLSNLIFFEAELIASNSYNRRLDMTYTNIRRGNILSIDGEILAYSEDVYGGGYMRRYPFPNHFSHITGYDNFGKSGIEAKYNFSLQTLSNELRQRADELITGHILEANSVILTVDSDLQKFVYEKIQNSGYNGGVVVMNYETGAILSICSIPSFNPNETAYEWDRLSSNEDSPLLNRASQGLYPPGSVFKIITGAAFIESSLDYSDFHYDCTGVYTFRENEIRCFNSNAHGSVDLKKAMIVSCNGYFAALHQQMDISLLREYAENFLFNQPYGYPLEYSTSSFAADENSREKELLDTYYGQGKTVTSPLHMALCAAAIANDGLIMSPYISDSTVSYDGTVLSKTEPAMLKQAILPETAILLKDMMFSVVTDGTGRDALINDALVNDALINSESGILRIAAKTGTAQNESELEHSWFISFSEGGNLPIVVSIVLENTGGGSKATIMAREIYEFLNFGQ